MSYKSVDLITWFVFKYKLRNKLSFDIIQYQLLPYLTLPSYIFINNTVVYNKFNVRATITRILHNGLKYNGSTNLISIDYKIGTFEMKSDVQLCELSRLYNPINKIYPDCIPIRLYRDYIQGFSVRHITYQNKFVQGPFRQVINQCVDCYRIAIYESRSALPRAFPYLNYGENLVPAIKNINFYHLKYRKCKICKCKICNECRNRKRICKQCS